MKYTVQASDEEYTIANKFNVSVGSLRKANDKLPQPYLVEGRQIEVPNEDNEDNKVNFSQTASNYSRPTYSNNVSDDNDDKEEDEEE